MPIEALGELFDFTPASDVIDRYVGEVARPEDDPYPIREILHVSVLMQLSSRL